MLSKLKIFVLSGSFLALICSGLSLPAQTYHPQTYKPWARLVSFTEGKTIVEAAWEHRLAVDYKPDCSHLVHEIYSMIGLDYKYVPSRALYRGAASSFQRVFRPQPGDLIVWLGHVGIVVSPKEHSFYSSLRSGLMTNNYITNYWRHRGHPRFYRYRLAPGTQVLLPPPEDIVSRLHSAEAESAE